MTAGSTGKKSTIDMTEGTISRLLISFAVPMLVGNLFQQLYNTVDSLVVGNFVGVEALAAVGATTNIVNTLVKFFNGVSIGAGIVISHRFGAKDEKGLHTAVETTMAVTFLCCILFTLIGVVSVPYTLRAMATPADVFDGAATYLYIYFGGIAGLLIYNMGSAVLRAVGNSRWPLYFLVVCSVMNVILDLIFVIGMHWGIGGVAWATIISQGISAVLTLWVLVSSREAFVFRWKELCLDRNVLRDIALFGLPTGLQQSITALSNVFVHAYINAFGSVIMAAWSVYSKVDQYIFLPLMSMSQAATTFTGQNVGAGKPRRAAEGVKQALFISFAISAVMIAGVCLPAGFFTSLFSSNEGVIRYGAMFLRINCPFMMLCCVNQVVAGGMRGFGQSKAPMYAMLISQVLMRQIYLFIVTKFSGSVIPVLVSFPFGWTFCCIFMLILYFRYLKSQKIL